MIHLRKMTTDHLADFIAGHIKSVDQKTTELMYARRMLVLALEEMARRLADPPINEPKLTQLVGDAK